MRIPASYDHGDVARHGTVPAARRMMVHGESGGPREGWETGAMTGDAHRRADLARRHMVEGGFTVSDGQLPVGSVVVGSRSTFRFRWLATRLHLFVVVLTVPTIDASTLEQFLVESTAYAREHTRWWNRSVQQAVAVVPVVVCDVATGPAVTVVEQLPRRDSGLMTLPWLVDAATGRTHSSVGKVVFGAIYRPWLDEQIGALLAPA